MEGKLVSIWKKRAHGGPMDPLESAGLIAALGLEGSADQGGRRQITLIEAEVFEAISRELACPLDPAVRRANLMVEGVRLADSGGRILGIGPVRIRILGETRPCEVMDAAVPGLRSALSGGWRGGAYGEVLVGGRIQCGDSVRWIDPGAADA